VDEEYQEVPCGFDRQYTRERQCQSLGWHDHFCAQDPTVHRNKEHDKLQQKGKIASAAGSAMGRGRLKLGSFVIIQQLEAMLLPGLARRGGLPRLPQARSLDE